PLLKKLVTDETRQMVESYVADAIKKPEIERSSEGREKTGVFTGSYATNPANGEKIPIWVADYVLWGYGTGAIMAVPAHDERDFAFAEKFGLPIIEVVEKPSDSVETCYHGEGLLINSDIFDGISTAEAREQIVAWLEQQGVGRTKTTYKMRDWLISRQRYWGAPIPIIHCPEHGAVPVPEKDLPVLLPEVDDFEPKGDGKSPLSRQTDWVQTTCPTCGGPAKRETDVMDGYACSSWYLLRYTDPHNAAQAWAPEKAAYWTPLDMYIGGDHAVAHLLYVRFWNHVFYDMNLVPEKEPVKKLVYHGLIQAEDGRKMSKSLGNVVDPLEVIDAGYGADALRTFELFLGPINEDSSWSSKGIAGVYRFLNRVWTLTQEYIDSDHDLDQPNQPLESLTHATIKKVTDDIYRLSFNTAIAAQMEFVNELYKIKLDGFSAAWQPTFEALVRLIQPFAPHMAAELWQQLGHDSQLDFVDWPEWDEQKIISENMTIVVQVNGKVRATLEVSADATEDAIKSMALANENVTRHLKAEPKKVIYIKNKLLSIVV
ncbi:leucine--tRNA ligase, partial [Candidatus Saccharibacteria bacterium]|nr:leucine--tRNA ligase [Candidatus Saccharibacteria bacterium]